MQTRVEDGKPPKCVGGLIAPRIRNQFAPQRIALRAERVNPSIAAGDEPLLRPGSCVRYRGWQPLLRQEPSLGVVEEKLRRLGGASRFGVAQGVTVANHIRCIEGRPVTRRFTARLPGWTS